MYCCTAAVLHTFRRLQLYPRRRRNFISALYFSLHLLLGVCLCVAASIVVLSFVLLLLAQVRVWDIRHFGATHVLDQYQTERPAPRLLSGAAGLDNGGGTGPGRGAGDGDSGGEGGQGVGAKGQGRGGGGEGQGRARSGRQLGRQLARQLAPEAAVQAAWADMEAQVMHGRGWRQPKAGSDGGGQGGMGWGRGRWDGAGVGQRRKGRELAFGPRIRGTAAARQGLQGGGLEGGGESLGEGLGRQVGGQEGRWWLRLGLGPATRHADSNASEAERGGREDQDQGEEGGDESGGGEGRGGRRRGRAQWDGIPRLPLSATAPFRPGRSGGCCGQVLLWVGVVVVVVSDIWTNRRRYPCSTLATHASNSLAHDHACRHTHVSFSTNA